MPQKIRVGRSENLFFFFFQTLIDVIHDQDIDNHDIIID